MKTGKFRGKNWKNNQQKTEKSATKKGSVKHQIVQNLREQLDKGMGTSKHNDKVNGINLGLSQHEAYKGKIYSVKTFQNYRDLNMQAVDWMRSEGLKVTDLADFRENMRDYLEHLKAEKYSAWTIRAHAAAAAKLWGCSSRDFGVDLPDRHADQRIHNVSENERKHLAKRYSHVLKFAELTGLRRSELEAFKKSNHIDFLNGKTDILHLDGKRDNTKGHRDREIHLTLEDAKQVRKILNENARVRDLDQPFKQLHKNLQIHLKRHDFAQITYNRELQKRQEEGIAYQNVYRRRDGSGRVYDKDCLKVVTEALGHSRIDTSIVNYLD